MECFILGGKNMKMQILEVVISIFVICLLMILHEFPKTLVYFLMTAEKGKKESWKKIFYLHRYIDPVGIIFGAVSYAGFSKPYMFRIQSQTKNKILGGIGFLTLIIIFIGSVCVLKFRYSLLGLTVIEHNITQIILQMFWIYMTILSGGMLLVNMFPVSVLDMGLLIAGTSPRHYLGIIKSDSIIKIILIFASAIGMIKYFSVGAINFILKI